ncbi:hypothetical protein [Streptomyces sp. NPDC041003]
MRRTRLRREERAADFPEAAGRAEPAAAELVLPADRVGLAVPVGS